MNLYRSSSPQPFAETENDFCAKAQTWIDTNPIQADAVAAKAFKNQRSRRNDFGPWML